MRRLVLGVIGHVDHGKTALVRALTGMETDRLAEEKRRGISIALGFAHLAAGPDAVIDLIDMPGHERFVRTMVAGATGIDAVLLVVAANEGIKPQTVEHIDIAGLLGLARAVVAVSKADLVAPEQAELVAADALDLLRRAGLRAPAPVMTSVMQAGRPPMPSSAVALPLPLAGEGRGEGGRPNKDGSSACGPTLTQPSPAGGRGLGVPYAISSAMQTTGIDTLRQALAALAGEASPREADGVAFLPIDRAFSVAGHGTVVTGTLRGAALAPGDALERLPGARPVRVRAVQVHGANVASALPGQRVAVNLRDVDASDLPRGAALAAPGALAPSEWMTVSLRSVAGAPALRGGTRLRALLGTAEVDARLRLLDRDVLEPGATAIAQLHFAEAVALPAREHVILRLASPAQTVAGGRVLEAEARRRRRHDTAALDHLAALAGLGPAEIVAAEVARAAAAGTTLQRLSRLSALAPARVAPLLERLPVVARGQAVMLTAAVEGVVARIPSVLTPHPAGLSRERLLAGLPGTGAEVLDEALARLLAAGTVRQQGGLLALPRPDADRARLRGEALLAADLAEALRRGGLTPPDAGVIASGLEGKRALDRLVREGVAVRAHDRAQQRVILFHQDAVEDAQRRLAPLLGQPPGLLVGEVGAALGISRKFSVPLLEHLDHIRFTRRIQDRRILAVAVQAE